VDPGKYLEHLRRAYGVPIRSFADMHKLPLPVVDYVADQTVRAAMKFGLAEGASLGLGGLFSILPDIGMLSAITVRMIQKLSLIHGFDYSTDEEVADLWIATASAAGVDLGMELIEKQVLERFVPRVIERVAIKAGSEITEKLAARMVPLLSAALGGTMNYYFLRAWGVRAQRHFRERSLFTRRHLGVGLIESASEAGPAELPGAQPLLKQTSQGG
jgi:hypothetical protein